MHRCHRLGLDRVSWHAVGHVFTLSTVFLGPWYFRRSGCCMPLGPGALFCLYKNRDFSGTSPRNRPTRESSMIGHNRTWLIYLLHSASNITLKGVQTSWKKTELGPRLYKAQCQHRVIGLSVTAHVEISMAMLGRVMNFLELDKAIILGLELSSSRPTQHQSKHSSEGDHPSPNCSCHLFAWTPFLPYMSALYKILSFNHLKFDKRQDNHEKAVLDSDVKLCLQLGEMRERLGYDLPCRTTWQRPMFLASSQRYLRLIGIDCSRNMASSRPRTS